VQEREPSAVASGLASCWWSPPWLQQSVLFLGHPSTASVVVLGSLLAGTGIGALAAGWLRAGISARWFWLLPAAAVGISLGMGPLFVRCSVRRWRCGVAAGVFIAAGVLLGLALPSGLMRFPREQRAWFWAVNGACGVRASALSIALAMTLGLRDTALLGAAAYVVAAFVVSACSKACLS
jgi:hypothetical protein